MLSPLFPFESPVVISLTDCRSRMSCVELSLADEEASSNSRYPLTHHINKHSHTPYQDALTHILSTHTLTHPISTHTLRTHSHTLLINPHSKNTLSHAPYQPMQVWGWTKRPNDRVCLPRLDIVHCQISTLLRLCRRLWNHLILHLRIFHDIVYSRCVC